MKKEDIILNKWYSSKYPDYFIKITKVITNRSEDITQVNCIENICGGMYKSSGDYWNSESIIASLKLADINDLAKYLPENHPDLNQDPQYEIY